MTIVANSSPEKYEAYLKERFPRAKVVPNPFKTGKPLPADLLEVFQRADMVLYNSGTTLSFGRWDRDWNRSIPLAIPFSVPRSTGIMGMGWPP